VCGGGERRCGWRSRDRVDARYVGFVYNQKGRRGYDEFASTMHGVDFSRALAPPLSINIGGGYMVEKKRRRDRLISRVSSHLLVDADFASFREKGGCQCASPIFLYLGVNPKKGGGKSCSSFTVFSNFHVSGLFGTHPYVGKLIGECY
jgi:hypothetical protein